MTLPNDSILIGNNTQSEGIAGIAVGKNAQSTTDDCVAIGVSSVAGDSTTVGNVANIAIGRNAQAPGLINSDSDVGHAIAIGDGATATDAVDMAIGWQASASGGESIAIGIQAQALAGTATAIGDNALVDTGSSSIAIGERAIVHGDHSSAFGPGATIAAGHNSSTAVGHDATTDRASQIMLGAGEVVDIPGAGNGLALRSPNGTRWLLTVSNAGAPVVTATP